MSIIREIITLRFDESGELLPFGKFYKSNTAEECDTFEDAVMYMYGHTNIKILNVSYETIKFPDLNIERQQITYIIAVNH